MLLKEYVVKERLGTPDLNQTLRPNYFCRTACSMKGVGLNVANLRSLSRRCISNIGAAVVNFTLGIARPQTYEVRDLRYYLLSPFTTNTKYYTMKKSA